MSRRRAKAEGAAGVRLQKVLARGGVCSRRGGEEMIRGGRVKVNGRVVTELGVRVDPEKDRVTVDGEPIVLERPVYLVLNKPDGVVSSAEGAVDERGRPTVMSLLHGVQERVFPVGRLDFHTRGVLLLTNDGALAATLTHPRHEVPKTYHVKLQGKLEVAELEALSTGLVLEDGTRTLPLRELFVIRETATNTWVQLCLAQGLHRQIRRMGDAIGHSVLKLIRVAVGDVTTDGLGEGEFRRLTEAEVEGLRHSGTPLAVEGSTSGRRRRGRLGAGRRLG